MELNTDKMNELEFIEILKDFGEINYIQGYHTGRWDDEYNRLETVKEYWNDLKEFADKYNIEYSSDINNDDIMIEFENTDDEEIYRMDNMGFGIKRSLDKLLIEKIINEVKNYD